MIDLHTHTSYSDGTWDVKTLLKKANKANIEVLSITDHDTVKAYLEMRDNDYSNLFQYRIINGVELNVIANGSSIELLVYDYDLDGMNKWCLETYKKPNNVELIREYNELFNSALRNGIILDNINYSFKNGYPIEIIYNEVKRHIENEGKFPSNAWDDYSTFLKYFSYDTSFPIYVNLLGVFPSVEEAVKISRELGGKVFLAHLYKYPNKHKELLDYLLSNNLLDGLEVFHSDFNKEQMDYLYSFCKSNGLLMSGGSDCHGKRKVLRRIGVGYNNLNIDKGIISNWYD